MLEGTLVEWEQWFQENRSEEYAIASSIQSELVPDQILIRLWAGSDGKPPKQVNHLHGPVWLNKNARTPTPNLMVLYAKCAPLILTLPELLPKIVLLRKSGMPKPLSPIAKKRKLKAPLHWRCRICAEEGETDKPLRHCGVRVRQLAPVTEGTTEWFTDFLENVTWKFVDPNDLRIPEHGFFVEDRALGLARIAGKEMENHLNGTTTSVPSRFELFDRRTDHLRVSDLKKKKKFVEAIKKSTSQSEELPSLLKTAPTSSVIELGHVFDEYLTSAFAGINSELWKEGSAVNFFCEELDLHVSGTPDLFIEDIPVESKTTAVLPHKGSKGKPNWRNYYGQLALYSRACNRDWMFLLLISRNTGEFSVIPFNAKEKMQSLRNNWVTWSEDEELMKMVEEYNKSIAEEE